MTEERSDEGIGLSDLFGGGWGAPNYRPPTNMDVELLITHTNYKYAKTDDEKKMWQGVVKGKWIDFNGGGYTWHGLSGAVSAWRMPPNAAHEPTATNKHGD